MSNGPHPEGVTRFLAKLARVDELSAKIDDLHPKAVAICAELKEAQEEYDKLRRTLGDDLEKMDMTSTGNFGYGNRVAWFIAEMRRQIIADAYKSATVPEPTPRCEKCGRLHSLAPCEAEVTPSPATVE